jgi:hypothetical protein
MSIYLDYFYTFILTATVELLVYLMIMPLFFKILDRKKICVMILPMNAITHPLFFFFIMGLPMTFLANILIAEFVMIAVEGFFLTRIFNLSTPKALALSAIVNLVSWQLGPLMTYLIQSKL